MTLDFLFYANAAHKSNKNNPGFAYFSQNSSSKVLHVIAKRTKTNTQVLVSVDKMRRPYVPTDTARRSMPCVSFASEVNQFGSLGVQLFGDRVPPIFCLDLARCERTGWDTFVCLCIGRMYWAFACRNKRKIRRNTQITLKTELLSSRSD